MLRLNSRDVWVPAFAGTTGKAAGTTGQVRGNDDYSTIRKE
jgi:hypothetical protein